MCSKFDLFLLNKTYSLFGNVHFVRHTGRWLV